ncbi:MAG: ADP-ribosylglycohydrolase family protein, partial [Planctomycetota bacterium]
NIDAKINAAYIVLGLLYGEGDLDKTIIITTRCGQDSDCNPSNSAGILFTTIGFKNLPDKFKSELNPEGKFSHTPYNFPTLVKVCEKLVRESVIREGGKIEKDSDGREIFVIPVKKPKPGKLEQCWEPGPIANSKFTKAEMEKITAIDGINISKAVSKFAPGWKIRNCGDDMDPGLRAEEMGKSNVLVTHPLDDDTGCELSRKVKLPAGKNTMLRLTVGHHPEGDWDLIVAVNGKEIARKTVSKETTGRDVWMQAEVNLSDYAGKEVKLTLTNQPTGWRFEAGYWAEISLVSQ